MQTKKQEIEEKKQKSEEWRKKQEARVIESGDLIKKILGYKTLLDGFQPLISDKLRIFNLFLKEIDYTKKQNILSRLMNAYELEFLTEEELDLIKRNFPDLKKYNVLQKSTFQNNMRDFIGLLRNNQLIPVDLLLKNLRTKDLKTLVADKIETINVPYSLDNLNYLKNQVSEYLKNISGQKLETANVFKLRKLDEEGQLIVESATGLLNLEPSEVFGLQSIPLPEGQTFEDLPPTSVMPSGLATPQFSAVEEEGGEEGGAQ